MSSYPKGYKPTKPKMDIDLPFHDNPKEAPNPPPNIRANYNEADPKQKKVDFVPASRMEKKEKKRIEV